MFNISLRKPHQLTLSRYVIVLSKLSFSDSSAIKVKLPFKIKEYCDDIIVDESKKKEFPKCFIQDLFINKFQEKVLEYPQLGYLKQVQSLKKQYCLVQELFDDTKENSTTNKLCKSNVENSVNVVRTFELTGFKLPRSENGFGYVNSEFSYMQEALGLNPSLSKSVSENDDYGVHLISAYGNEMQKEKYLKRLASGEIMASFAHLESESFAILDPDLIKTTAVLSTDKQNYIISGKKSWVYNAKHADLFILSANTTTENVDGVKETKPTLFLVPGNATGVRIHEPIQTVALKGISICDVTLDEVVVPLSSVLGTAEAGGNMIRELLSHGKLNNGAHCLPIMRELVNIAIKHCINNNFFKKTKYEKDYFKIKIGQIVSQVYAVESMTYLLTGRLDSFINPDVFLESLIVKIFASENLRSVLQKCIEIVGHEVITSENNWKEIIRDSQFYAASDITNDHLRLVLAITGVQHALDYKKKKPLTEKLVTDSISNALKFLEFDREDKCVTTGLLQGYLHCILYAESYFLEDGVAWLYECTNHLIKTYGEGILQRHRELKILADMVIYIYAETAILGRASRAYCLGVELSEVDRCIAAAALRAYQRRINKLGRSIKNRNKRPDLDKTERDTMNFCRYSELSSVLKNLKGDLYNIYFRLEPRGIFPKKFQQVEGQTEETQERKKSFSCSVDLRENDRVFPRVIREFIFPY